MLFKELWLIEPILKALEIEWYETPTPIQQKAIPIILAKKDIIWCAQTGTWKTAAFAIPTIQLLSNTKDLTKPRVIKSLILTPTRELAIQIEDSFKAYWKFTKIRHTVIFGWVWQARQVEALKQWVDVLVATPGRLLDLMNQWYVNLKHIEIFILDEADRMLDMWFVNDVKKILTKIPTRRQSLFFSATMSKEIWILADTILNNPEKVEITPVSTTAETINQNVYFVSKSDKKNLLAHILKDPEIKQALVFTRTKHWADRVVKELSWKWIMAEAIHWNKSQNARQRALNNFKIWDTRILIATDIAARWIDIDELGYVFNYDLPNESETYVHRIWRTWRAGNSWCAFSFCDEEEKKHLLEIQKLIWKQIPVIEDHPFPLISWSFMAENYSKNKVNPRNKTQRKKVSPEASENKSSRPNNFRRNRNKKTS